VTNQWYLYCSSRSQRINTGSADVDWGSWSEAWPAESHDHDDDQSQWTGWSNEPSTEANNHTSDKSHRKNPVNWNNSLATEGNLIDFGFDEEPQSKVLLFGYSGIQLFTTDVVVWHSGNVLHPINEVTLHRAGLVLGWVTACGQVNHLSM